MAEGTARAEGGVAVRGDVHRYEAAAGPEDTPYLVEPRALEVIGQVVQREAAGHEVERRIRERDHLDQGDLEIDIGAGLRHLLPGDFDHLGGGVNAVHLARSRARLEAESERARAAADVEHLLTGRRRGQLYELLTDRLVPPERDDSAEKVVPARPVEDAACRLRSVGSLVVHFRASSAHAGCQNLVEDVGSERLGDLGAVALMRDPLVEPGARPTGVEVQLLGKRLGVSPLNQFPEVMQTMHGAPSFSRPSGRFSFMRATVYRDSMSLSKQNASTSSSCILVWCRSCGTRRSRRTARRCARRSWRPLGRWWPSAGCAR